MRRQASRWSDGLALLVQETLERDAHNGHRTSWDAVFGIATR
jgi:hypothetical protein